MPERVDSIFRALMDDPDFEAFPGKDKAASAWATAWSRFRQMRKNEEALSLAKQYSDDPNKGATAMPLPIGKPTTFENTHSDARVRMKQIDSRRRNELGQAPLHPLDRMEALTKYLQDTYNLDIEKDYPPPGPPPRPGLVWRQETARWVRPGDASINRSVERDAIRERQKTDFHRMYPYGAPKSPTGSRAAEREVERNIQRAINVAGTKETEAAKRKQLLGRIEGIERRKNLPHTSGLQWVADKDLEKIIRGLEEKMQKQIRSPFAVATTAAKKMGFKRFTEGSPGREKRGEIAEALKRESRKSLDSFMGWLQKECGIEIQKQGPPGPPPRPGLVWRWETARWVRPNIAGAREKAMKNQIRKPMPSRIPLEDPEDKAVYEVMSRKIKPPSGTPSFGPLAGSGKREFKSFDSFIELLQKRKNSVLSTKLK